MRGKICRARKMTDPILGYKCIYSYRQSSCSIPGYRQVPGWNQPPSCCGPSIISFWPTRMIYHRPGSLWGITTSTSSAEKRAVSVRPPLPPLRPLHRRHGVIQANQKSEKNENRSQHPDPAGQKMRTKGNRATTAPKHLRDTGKRGSQTPDAKSQRQLKLTTTRRTTLESLNWKKTKPKTIHLVALARPKRNEGSRKPIDDKRQWKGNQLRGKASPSLLYRIEHIIVCL
jgi:hypothetical protein